MPGHRPRRKSNGVFVIETMGLKNLCRYGNM